jgi:hypothetical protein
MSDYFSGISEEKQFIPPDYSKDPESEKENIDKIIDDESITPFDESEEEELLDYLHELNKEENKKENKKEEENTVTSSPFPTTSSTPSWSGWGNNNQNNGGSFWSNNNQQNKSSWGSWGSSFGQTSSQQGQKEQINRNKKVIFCDFLDCIVETYQSNGQSGLLPRDIYDLKPRFDVWAKLAAFNPERIYIMVPRNLLPSTNGPDAWTMTLNYFCCSLSAFIRAPFNCCQILVQQVLGQPKETIIQSIINFPEFPVKKEEIVCIGIYSGENGQSNRDILAAQICDLDYIDLNKLINNMY